MSLHERIPRSRPSPKPPEGGGRPGLPRICYSVLRLLGTWLILLGTVAAADTANLTISTFPNVTSVDTSNLTHVYIAATDNVTQLYVTINICSIPTSATASNGTTTLPTIYLSNSSIITYPTTDLYLLSAPVLDNAAGNAYPPAAKYRYADSRVTLTTAQLQSAGLTSDLVSEITNEQLRMKKRIDDTGTGSDGGGGAGSGYTSGEGMIWNVTLYEGFGNWTGGVDDGGAWVMIDVNGVDGWVVEIGVGVDAPQHILTNLSPLLGDTTSTQSLLLSPILSPLDTPLPTYPNYTLSSPYPVNLTAPTNLTEGVDGGRWEVLVVRTDEAVENGLTSVDGTGLSQSLCAIQSAASAFNANLTTTGTDTDSATSAGLTTSSKIVQRREGWRIAFVTDGLTSGVNYTAWMVDGGSGGEVAEGGGAIGGRMLLATKGDDFPCPLVYDLPLCPGIAYAGALEPSTTTSPYEPVTSLPSNLTTTLENHLLSFSTSLLTTACGRDLYSPVSSCADCWEVYREWLCRVLIPQCGATSSDSDSSSDSNTDVMNATISDSGLSTTISPQTVSRNASSARTGYTSSPSYDYEELLPCLASCTKVQRACPVFLGFACPVKKKVWTRESYAFVWGENALGVGEGEEGGTDDWGNRWCNGWAGYL